MTTTTAYETARAEAETLLGQLRGLESVAPPTGEQSATFFQRKVSSARHGYDPAGEVERIIEMIEAAIVAAQARVAKVQAAQQALAAQLAADPAVQAAQTAASAAEAALATVSAQATSKRAAWTAHEQQGPASLQDAADWEQQGRTLAGETRFLEAQLAEAWQTAQQARDALERARRAVITAFREGAENAVMQAQNDHTEAREELDEARRLLDVEHAALIATAVENAWAARIAAQ